MLLWRDRIWAAQVQRHDGSRFCLEVGRGNEGRCGWMGRAVWQGGERGEPELLASCYRRSIELCHKHLLDSVAFPAISTGIFRFPADLAASIAVSTAIDATREETSLSQIVFCCFSEQSAELHDQALSEAIIDRGHAT